MAIPVRDRAIPLVRRHRVSLSVAVNRDPRIHAQTREEVVLWESIKNSNRARDFIAYLDAYPNGAFVPLAKSHLEDLTPFTVLQFAMVGVGSDFRTWPKENCASVPPSENHFERSHLPANVLIYMNSVNIREGDYIELLAERPDGTVKRSFGLNSSSPFFNPGFGIHDPERWCANINPVPFFDTSSPIGHWKIIVRVNRIDKMEREFDLRP